MRFLRIAFFALSIHITFAYEAPENRGAIKEAYINKRKQWLQEDANLRLSANIILNEKEQKVDNHIKEIISAFQKQFQTSNLFCPSRNFLLVKTCIETSPLFAILKAMPKGGALHLHTHATGNATWLVHKAASSENSYIYMREDNKFPKGTMKMFKKDAVPDGFQSMYELVTKDPQFISKVVEMITMTPADTNSVNPWDKFQTCFTRVYNIINYEPIFREYYVHAFEQMAADNVEFIEIRSGLSTLYDLNGNTFSNNQVVDIFRNVVNKVREKYPNFQLKIIVSDLRSEEFEKQFTLLERAFKLRADNPDLIVGYDLVGFESAGHTTYYFLDNLLNGAIELSKKYNTELPYYFHDGESDWANNDNLYDAVLLNCKRIGHAFNLFNFPFLIQQVKKQDICIEVCPISNQILGYVNDLRLHPASGYVKAGIPCIISSDDPMIFETKGLSYDLWEAVMAWNLDLRDLKQFFISSIKYSSFDEQTKRNIYERWLRAWDKFIIETIEAHDLR